MHDNSSNFGTDVHLTKNFLIKTGSKEIEQQNMIFLIKKDNMVQKNSKCFNWDVMHVILFLSS